MMFYLASGYLWKPIQLPEFVFPPEVEVGHSFQLLVKGEFGAKSSRGDCPAPVRAELREDIPSAFGLVEEYAIAAEAAVYDGTIRLPTPRYSEGSFAEQVFSILADPLVGNTANRKTLRDASDLFRRIADLASRRLPLQFLVPAFPFKDQNPFRTPSSAASVDFGEIAHLVRLHVLALALSAVYPFGVEWIIVSDGQAYADVFGIPRQDATAYVDRLRDWRNRLNYQATVHILDLEQVTKQLGTIPSRTPTGAASSQDFRAVVSDLHTVLDSLSQSGESTIEESLAVLTRGIRWNLSSRRFLKDWSRQDLWHALNQGNSLDSEELPRDLAELISASARKVALEYASFNLASSWANVLGRVFPSAIRATVHPKAGQVAIPRCGDTYPWNGSALVVANKPRGFNVESHELFKLERSGVIPVYVDGSSEPFFYRSVDGAF